jgi:hypothetical protein
MSVNQGLQGAAGGAMAGAAFGPWGAAIGGALGGLGGLFGSDPADQQKKYAEQLQKLSAGYGNRAAPQAGAAAQGQYSGFRQNQAGLISQLEAMARGEGPSAAQMQMREAMDRAAGAQSSAMAGAGGRGVNAGAAFRNASNNTAAVQAQGARDTATIRAQEQLNAYGQLGQAINQGRGADENMNQFNAGAQNQMAMANLQAQLQTLGLNDEAQLRALMAAMGANTGPGLGTQILAGGASAFPSILQYQQGQKPGMSPIAQGYAGGGGYYTPMAGGSPYPSAGPVTMPGQSGQFGQYTRPIT